MTNEELLTQLLPALHVIACFVGAILGILITLFFLLVRGNIKSYKNKDH